jgi:hypothetical protein
MKDGYWPPKPIEWNPLPGKNNASEKELQIKIRRKTREDLRSVDVISP